MSGTGDIGKSTCPYCGVGCGVVLAEQDGRIEVRGDPDHPANRGRLCVKGAALGETLGLDGRLLHPAIGGRRVGWSEALDAVARGFRRAIAEAGPDAVALYVSGQCLTEDYYVANKLMKGFVGSANIDTNSRLCMASSVAGHIRAFGSDTVPGCYDDLEHADLVVLVGSNAAWCHPVLFRRIEAARARRPTMRLVVVDPRRTATAAGADLHLAIKPGSDVALFNGLLRHLSAVGRIDRDFVDGRTSGLTAALAAADSDRDPGQACGLAPSQIDAFYELFAATERTVTCYSQGVNQSVDGTDKVNAILNCHLLMGRIGRPGMGPFSLTGQPNAMGGREVGGLANQLAAHMNFDAANVDRVRRFWRAPRMATAPGLKAVEMFRAVETGRIRAIWIMATNPAVSLPEAGLVRTALERGATVVVSDCFAETDTAKRASVLLPALAWGEKDGTVTNSERRISRQRALLPAPGEARPDWWALAEVAARLGHAEAFSYAGPGEIFREHCRLSAFENAGTRDFDLSGLIDADYDAVAPIQWPVLRPGQGTARLFGDGRFFHADGKARFVAVSARAAAEPPSAAFPFILNTGRERDQWHTMTRTGRAPRLSNHAPQPTVALAPADATRLALVEGALMRVLSRLGDIVLPLRLDPGQRPGEIFVPIHWSDTNASGAVVGRLIAAHVDALSGQPELKRMPARIEAYAAAWHATIHARAPLAFQDAGYWCRATGDGYFLHHLAGADAATDWPVRARAWLGDGDWIETSDPRRGLYRAACLREGRLEAVLMVAPGPPMPGGEWPAQHFRRSAIPPDERPALLAGAPRREIGDRTICACFGVGLATLRAAIADRGLSSAEDVGRALRAGTNCGSCLPEIRALLPARAAEAA